jgi:uncharacterized protein YbjT (DUF2867 family)
MPVFVTGGTGAIGGHAVPAIGGHAVPAQIGAGHTVTALARSDARSAVLRGQGATPVLVSLFVRALRRSRRSRKCSVP